MTDEKILDIARRYTVPKEESSLLVEFNGDEVPTPTGETMNLMMWNFCEEELLAFAQSVIEAYRESSDEPVAWAYITKDCKIVHYEFVEGLVPLYRRPSLARKPLSEDLVEALEGMLNIVNDSQGVVGYHLSGAVANWGEFEEVDIAATALEKAHGIGRAE